MEQGRAEDGDGGTDGDAGHDEQTGPAELLAHRLAGRVPERQQRPPIGRASPELPDEELADDGDDGESGHQGEDGQAYGLCPNRLARRGADGLARLEDEPVGAGHAVQGLAQRVGRGAGRQMDEHDGGDDADRLVEQGRREPDEGRGIVDLAGATDDADEHAVDGGTGRRPATWPLSTWSWL